MGTFGTETANGWQTLTFTGVKLTKGLNYTAAVQLPAGHYAVTTNYPWPAVGVSLTGFAGTYKYGSTVSFPSDSFNKANYFVDVVFSASTTTSAAATTAKPATTSTTAKATTTTTTAKSATSTTTSTTTAKAATTTTTTTAKAATSTTTAKATTTTTTGTPPSTGWPDATNTGVAQCPPLTRVNNGDEVVLNTAGQVYQNVELLNAAIIRVLAPNVTIRCVKMNGIGYYGVDNTERATAINLLVDQIDITCLDTRGVGLLIHDAVVSRANVHNCDDAIHAGGDHLVIRDSYCHDLIDKVDVHADCIQSLGGNTGLLIEHNSLYSRDTSDVLLGQEYGDSHDVVINNNRFMSVGSPPPAYLLYLSGTNTRVTNNRFTRRYTYGACTLITNNPFVWSGNVWDDDGTTIPTC